MRAADAVTESGLGENCAHPCIESVAGGHEASAVHLLPDATVAAQYVGGLAPVDPVIGHATHEDVPAAGRGRAVAERVEEEQPVVAAVGVHDVEVPQPVALGPFDQAQVTRSGVGEHEVAGGGVVEHVAGTPREGVHHPFNDHD